MLRIEATPELVATYRRLLTEDWTSRLPDEVLQLLERAAVRIVPRAAMPTTMALVTIGEFSNGSPLTFLRQVKSVFSMKGLPGLPEPLEFSRKPTKFSQQALHFAEWFCVPGMDQLSGDLGFWRDLQSLAFEAVIHYCLPKIRKAHPTEHALLLNSLVLVLLEFADDDHAHWSYLSALLHGYLGNHDERIRHLTEAFLLTPQDDHSYLTKAQEIWSDLLDLGKYEAAKEFLFSLHWRCLPHQKDEVRSMVEDGLEQALLRRPPRRKLRTR